MLRFLFITLILSTSLEAGAARTLDKNIGWPGETLAGNECYGQSQGFGPFDYTDPASARKDGRYGASSPKVLVEGAHFTPNVERLVRGKSSGVDPSGDIDYTLRAFPNHHRALWSMSRYYLRKINTIGIEALLAKERPQAGLPPPECYFQRAKAFAPEDTMVSAVFGIYLHRRGLLDAALSEYTHAEAKHARHPELVYNMGLLFLDLGQIEKAKEYAGRARSLGYPLGGLSKKIQRAEAEVRGPAAYGKERMNTE